MGEHLCGKASPPSAHSSMTSTSSNGSSASSNGNPFALRTANANPSKPATPSPLQFDSAEQKPPPTRARAPTLGSNQPPRAPRPALPRINPDTANKPFLAPIARPESPISPALSSRSGGSSAGPRPPPLRSMTSPVGPRIFDPRPPSPELSANLDCAFPPFPTSTSSDSRPSTSNGRKTPNGERAPSRNGGSRQDGRWLAEKEGLDLEPKSPRTNGGENVMERMNTLKSGPFDASRRRPSRDEKQEQASGALHGRRPSMPQNPPAEPLPSLPNSKFSQPSRAAAQAERAPSPERKGSDDKKGPPQRPARPPTEECPSPSFLDQFSAEPVSITPLDPPTQDPRSANADHSQTFPLPPDRAPSPGLGLTKVKSEPEMRGRLRRPTLNAESKTEPASIPQASFPARSQSRHNDRVDHRLDNAPPVPKPIQQLNRSNSQHRPSGSGSSTASSVNSIGNANSSTGGPSPIGSAASSIDQFSPLSFEADQYGDDRGMRVAGLNVKNQKPGMRAELPREKKSPPRDFSRPIMPSQPFPPPPEEQEVMGKPGSDWPLESPMDPAMSMTHGPKMPGAAPARPASPMRSVTTPNARPAQPGLSIPGPANDDYDPFRPKSPMPPSPQQQQPPQQHMRARSKTNTGPAPRVPSPNLPPMPRSHSPQPMKRPFSPPQGPPPHQAAPMPRSRSPQPPQQQRPFSPPKPLQAQTTPQSNPSTRPLQPPPIPQDPTPRPALARRQTSAKAICRGCSHQIEGKSVKAADGRLTGRWHKACFVCRTCRQPFTTADFYVIGDQPFCEQHYHEENGSLCAGCERGIEGQYLETAPTSTGGGAHGGAGMGERKFHPRCFVCVDCRVVLRDDYFEIGGRVFCERHALANMRSQARMAGPGGMIGGPGGHGMGGAYGGLQPPGSGGPGRSPLVAAKRTTRLMMM